MAEVLKQPEAHPIRAWIEYLRTEVRNMVAPRLVQAGVIQRVQSSGMLRKSVRFPAVEPIKAAAPRARLRYMLDHPEYLDGHTAVLGGLARATGLEHVLGAGTSRGGAGQPQQDGRGPAARPSPPVRWRRPGGGGRRAHRPPLS